MRIIVGVFISFFVLNVCGMSVYDRTASLKQWERDHLTTLTAISDAQLVERFKKCSKNLIYQGKTAIDGFIEARIQSIASNDAGRLILRMIVARVEPLKECALSIAIISNKLTTPDDQAAYCIFNFFDALIGFSGTQDFVNKIPDIATRCDELLNTPKVFNLNDSSSVMSKFGTDSAGLLIYMKSQLGTIKTIFDALIPLLLEKTFELAIGDNAFHHLDNKISVSPTAQVKANFITGLKTYYSIIDTFKVYDAHICSRQIIDKDVCFIHEASHYFRKALDGKVAKKFNDLIAPLNAFLPKKYLSNALFKTFTDDEEFRNITGILFNGGILYFDPITEAAYALQNAKGIRCSHSASFIPRIPFMLVDKISELSGRLVLTTIEEIEYSEMLNLW